MYITRLASSLPLLLGCSPLPLFAACVLSVGVEAVPLALRMLSCHARSQDARTGWMSIYYSADLQRGRLPSAFAR